MTKFFVPAALAIFCLSWAESANPGGLTRFTRQARSCDFSCRASKDCTEKGLRCGTDHECHYNADALLNECDCGLADKYEYLIPGVAEDATRSASPWHVGIYQIRTSTFYSHICTGVLIFRDVVLTTATCMYDSETYTRLEPRAIKVAAKQTRDYFLDDLNQQKFDVATIKVLDGYEGDYRGFVKNIALIFLTTPASRPGIHPICLYTKPDLPGDWQYVKLTGWGILPVSNTSRSKNIKHARLNYSNIWKCTEKHGTPLNRKVLTSDKFCMEFTSEANISDEDSGGPCCIYWKGRHYLVGVLSNKFKLDTHFGVATRLYRYLPWIEYQVKTTRTELTCQKLSNPFHCGDGLGCVPLNALCDGLKACPNGADEDDVHCNQAGGEGRCLVPDGLEVYMREDCVSDPSCRSTRYAQSGVYYQVSCPLGYNFAPDPRPVSTLCYQGVWNPIPPACHKQCAPVTSNTLDVICRYQGKDISCDQQLQPNTTIDFFCKPAYKKEEGALYRSPTQCREDGQLHYLLTDCIPQCGAVNAAQKLVPQISNGRPARPGSFPWLAAIYWREGDKYAHKCGGTIIATNKILTAAHCVHTRSGILDDEDIAVATGKYYREWTIKDDFDQRFKVKRKEIGLHYNGVAGAYGQDIAVLILSTSIELNAFNAPACLDLDSYSGGIPSNQFGFIGGWGHQADGTQPAKLLETTLAYLDLEECRAKFNKEFTRWLTPDKFCVLYFNNSGTQTGDSGGGLTFIHNDLHYVYGIVSIKHKDSNEFAAFTNIQSHAQWLKNILALED